MISFWSVVRFLHVASALLWVGGQLTLSLVVSPAARRFVPDEARDPLFADVGRRFGRLALVALMPLLLTTGIALAWHRGVGLAALTLPGYGSLLSAKVLLAFVTFGLAGLHGALAARREAGAARWLGISASVVSLAVVLVATALVP